MSRLRRDAVRDPTFDPARCRRRPASGFSFARLRFASRLFVRSFLFACACVRLLGPCFKTGRQGRSRMSRGLSVVQRRRSSLPDPSETSEARVAERRAKATDGFVTERLRSRAPRAGRGLLRRRSTTAAKHKASRPSDRAERRLALAVSFPSDGFAFSLTLSSESFSTFPRGTCSLSVSRSVSSLGWGEPPGFGLRSQTTRLSNRRAVSTSRLARDAGPTPSLGRIRSGRVARARLSAYFDCRRSLRHMSTAVLSVGRIRR